MGTDYSVYLGYYSVCKKMSHIYVGTDYSVYSGYQFPCNKTAGHTWKTDYDYPQDYPNDPAPREQIG